MAQLNYDLHIHSSLSPCAEDDMTPANVCGMARLKGLDLIGITDHNSALALPYFELAAAELGLLFVPGIEVTTREEVHLLGYFTSVLEAMEAGRFFTAHLPRIKNRPSVFGNQTVFDQFDEPVATEEAMLIGATDLSITKCVAKIRELGGVCVPAHINRGANGLLVNLGFIPEDMAFNTLEVSKSLPIDNRITLGKAVLHSSDAHRLGDISEAENSMLVSAGEIGIVHAKLASGHF